MATVLKKMKLVNPGRRRSNRRPSAKQLAARAKFTAMVRAKNPKRKSTMAPSKRQGLNRKQRKAYSKGNMAAFRAYGEMSRMRENQRVGNPGEIITIGLNPGKVRKVRKVKSIMAKTSRKRRKSIGLRRVNSTRRRRRVAVTHHRRRTRRSNPARVVARRRHSYTRLHNRRRRRNPGGFGGGIKTTGVMIAGVIGGAILTKKLVDVIAGMWPAAGAGFMKYITTGAVASILGYGISRFAKSPQLGSGVALGGYTLVGLQVASDLIPGFSGYNPFGMAGMGMIMPSSFYTPQVPMSGSMNQFVTPSAVMAAMPVMKGLKGMGNVVTQPGRTRLTRVA